MWVYGLDWAGAQPCMYGLAFSVCYEMFHTAQWSGSRPPPSGSCENGLVLCRGGFHS